MVTGLAGAEFSEQQRNRNIYLRHSIDEEALQQLRREILGKRILFTDHNSLAEQVIAS